MFLSINFFLLLPFFFYVYGDRMPVLVPAKISFFNLLWDELWLLDFIDYLLLF